MSAENWKLARSPFIGTATIQHISKNICFYIAKMMSFCLHFTTIYAQTDRSSTKIPKRICCLFVEFLDQRKLIRGAT